MNVSPRAAALVVLALAAPAAVPRTSAAQDAPLVEVREELFSLGGVGAAPAAEFFELRRPFLLPDGRLVVPDAGSAQIRFFGPDLGLLMRVGREGDGPGEYRQIERVFPYRGDSLAVFDSRSQRVTMLNGEGTRGRTLSLADGGTGAFGGLGAQAPAGRTFVTGVYADGSLLVRRGELSVGSGDTTTVRRDRFRYVRIDPEGRPISTPLVLRDDEHFVWADGRSRSVRRRAFGKTTAVEVHGDRTFVADNSTFGVVAVDASGDTVATFRARRGRRPVEEGDRERWLRAELDKLEGSMLRDVAEQAIRAMVFPDTMPHHADLVVGADGRVWLEEYRPDASERSVWTVFRPDGDVEVRYAFPAGFRLSWADSLRAVGAQRDDLDIESVAAYRLPDRR